MDILNFEFKEFVNIHKYQIHCMYKNAHLSCTCINNPYNIQNI